MVEDVSDVHCCLLLELMVAAGYRRLSDVELVVRALEVTESCDGLNCTKVSDIS